MPVAGRLVGGRGAVYDRVDRDQSTSGRPRGFPGAEVVVFSFIGVLGITLVLFLVVALTGRLILGR